MTWDRLRIACHRRSALAPHSVPTPPRAPSPGTRTTPRNPPAPPATSATCSPPVSPSRPAPPQPPFPPTYPHVSSNAGPPLRPSRAFLLPDRRGGSRHPPLGLPAPLFLFAAWPAPTAC